MTPVAFHGHAGWLHSPRPGAPGSARGVVLCAPWGYEALCTHRALRDLATRLAAAGFPVLRFDWRGSGDSLGGEEAGPADWIDGIAEAASWLRAHAGSSQLSLVGLRLGALLAAAAAPRCGADELVLLAPPFSGQTALREARALALLSRDAEQEPDGTLRHAGFPFTPSLQRDIAALSPWDAVGARRVLLLDRDPGGAACRAIRTALERRQAEVEISGFPGLAALLQDARVAATPAGEWAEVAAWLGSPVGGGRPALPPPPVLAGDGFRETALVLDGSHATPARLAGVLCEPVSPAAPLTALFLNTGANRHIGYGRFAVDMARDLARHGIASLRLDGAGIGDSDARPGGGQVVYTPNSTADIAAALDALQARGHRRFAVVGICSGAYAAWHATLADPRIFLQVLVNLQLFVWREGDPFDLAPPMTPIRATRTYLQTLRTGATWRRLASGQVDLATVLRGLRRRYGARLRAQLGPLIEGPGAARVLVRRDLRGLQARGTRTLFVYSADDPGIEAFTCHLGHGGRLLRRVAGASSVLIDGADHNLARPGARARFAALLREALLEAPPQYRPAWAALRPRSLLAAITRPAPMTRSARNA